MGNFSLIMWANSKVLLNAFSLPSLTPPQQQGPHEVQAVVATPTGKHRNMGQAYNGALNYAKYPIKVFAHQDVVMDDPDFLSKIEAMFECREEIGLIGILGSRIDTGGGFWHAPANCIVGATFNAEGSSTYTPQCAQVRVIDCLLFATNLDLPFAECYEKSHMVAEDYCMRVRQQGKEVWTVDSLVQHLSGGTIEDRSYWRSMEIFRRKWQSSLPDNLPSVSTYHQLYRNHARPGGRYAEEAWMSPAQAKKFRKKQMAGNDTNSYQQATQPISKWR